MRIPVQVIKAIDGAVEHGATRLDQRRPNWYKDIDLRTLDMCDSCHCICGQLYGNYGEGSLTTIIGGWIQNLWGNYDSAAARYGFVLPNKASDWANDHPDYYNAIARLHAVWNRLERKWKEEIKTRLATERVAA